jgi:molybdopterin-guanine dinucleotide biosynthesis protein MobB
VAVPCICLIGWSGSGKTTLLTRLIPELRALGLRVLALKHSGHAHPLHKPDSDTERLRAAGAQAVGFATPEGVQLTLSGDPAALVPALLDALADRFDLVVVEGWKDGPFPKVEVFRAGLGESLAQGRTDAVAVVTDDPPPVPLPHFRTGEVSGLARFLLRLAGPGASSQA